MVESLLATIVEITLRIHQKFHSPATQHTCANRSVAVAAARANVVFRSHQKLRHRLRTQIAWHNKMPDFVPSKICDFAGAVPLMPVRSDQDPSVSTDKWKESFVWRTSVRLNILLVNAVTDTASAKFVHDFRAVPVFVKVES